MAWTILIPGYVTRVTFDDALRVPIEIGDSDRPEHNAMLFDGTYDLGEKPALLGGLDPFVGFPATGSPLFSVGETESESGEHSLVHLDYLTGPLPVPALKIPGPTGIESLFGGLDRRIAREVVNNIARDYAQRSTDFEFWGRLNVFPGLGVELYWPTTGQLAGTFEAVSQELTRRPRGILDRDGEGLAARNVISRDFRISVHWDSDTDYLDAAGADATGIPAVGTRFEVRLVVNVATDRTPYHWQDHPVLIANAIHDALGRTTGGVASTTIALGPFLRVALRPRAPESMGDVLQWLYSVFGFAHRITRDGVYEFYVSRAPNESVPTLEIEHTDLRDEGAPVWENEERTICNALLWELEQYAPQPSDTGVDQRTSDGLRHAKDSFTIESAEDFPGATDPDPAISRRTVTYRMPGTILWGKGGALATWIRAESATVFYRYGRGAARAVLGLHSDRPDLVVGEFVIVDLEHIPVPRLGSITKRGREHDPPGRQVMQITQRSETPEGPELTVEAVGLVLDEEETLPVPTLSIAANATAPKNQAVVTITNPTDLDDQIEDRFVRLQFGIDASVEPSGFDTWALRDVLGTGSIQGDPDTLTPLLDGGSRVWVRARVETADRAGDWSSVVNVDLADLSPPTSLTATAVDDTTYDLAWAIGELDVPIVVEAKRDTDTNWTRYAKLPAGTTKYRLVLDAASTDYDVQVYHEEAAPLAGVSTAATTSITTGGTLPALSAPTNPQVSAGGGEVELCVTVTEDGAEVVFEAARITEPDEVSGLEVWHDAGLETYEDGAGTNPAEADDEVLNWGDQSGNSIDMTQSGGQNPRLRAAVVNSLPALEFDGGVTIDRLAKVGGWTTPQDITILAVVRLDSVEGGGQPSHLAYMRDEFNSNNRRFLVDTTSARIGYADSVNAQVVADVGVGTGTFYVVAWRVRSTGLAVDFWRNNIEQGTGVLTGTPPTASINRLYYGDVPDVGDGLNAHLAEIVIYSRALSVPEVDSLGNYFALKYDLFTPTYEEWDVVPGGPVGSRVCSSFTAPNDGSVYLVRARHRLIGHTDSDPTTEIEVDPYGSEHPTEPTDAGVVLTAADPSFPSGRVLTPGDNTSVVDGGAGGAVTVDSKVRVAKAGTTIGTRRRINLIEGSNVTLNVTDDAGSDEVDVEIVSSAAGSGTTVAEEGTEVGTRGRINFIAGSGATLTITDDPGNDEIDIEIAAGIPEWLAVHPDNPPTSADADDDEFHDLTGQSGPVNGLDAKWSWANQGTSTLSFANSCAVLTAEDSAADLRLLYQAVPVGSWTIRCKVAISSNSDSAAVAGLAVAAGNGATDNIVTIEVVVSDTGHTIQTTRYNDYDISGASSITWDALFGRYAYFEIAYDGTNIVCRYSASGADGTFIDVRNETTAAFLGTPAYFGIFGRNVGVAPDAVAAFDWFRRVA